MKLTPFNVILDHLADKSPIEAVAGKLISLYKMKVLPGRHGDWSKQEGEIQDASGTVMKIQFRLSCNEIPSNYRGKSVTIRSVDGDRGLRGLAVHDDEYQGNVKRFIQVNDCAVIDWEGGSHQHAPATQETAPPARQQAPATQQAPAENKPAKGGLSLRKRMLKLATVYTHAFDAAVAIAHVTNAKHKYAMAATAVGIVADKLYIDAVRGLGWDGLATVDETSVDWSAAKGKTLRDHAAALGEQVEAHNAAIAAKQAPPPDDPPPPAEKYSMPGPDDDDIPF